MNIKAYIKYKYRRFYRLIIPKRILNYKQVKHRVINKIGLEVGGPSKIFNDIIDIYSIAQRIDGCNFGTKTIWEGNIEEGKPFTYNGKELGTQYISDATDLGGIANETYDFLASSHCLEHVANPIKALKEWARVLKKGGFLILVLPNPEFTFDHKRHRTSFEHLVSDFEKGTEESDLTHLQDVIDNCDLSRVFVLNGNGETMSYETHVQISSDNPNLRAIHHHVFSDSVVINALEFSGFELVAAEHFKPFHMIYLCTKSTT